jgi:hypothetical protein
VGGDALKGLYYVRPGLQLGASCEVRRQGFGISAGYKVLLFFIRDRTGEMKIQVGVHNTLLGCRKPNPTKTHSKMMMSTLNQEQDLESKRQQPKTAH